MDSSSHNHIMLWLLASLAAISSFIGLFISYKILKEVENLQRRSRILSNETKENKRNT